jgi:cell division protein FtsB
MDQLWTAIITTACTVAASLLVTYLFNKLSGVPKRLSDEKKAREQKIASLEQKNAALETKIETMTTDLTARIVAVEECVARYPEYRAQSLAIQQQLRDADTGILDVCKAIKDEVQTNRNLLDTRLKSLESREKNALRDKIYKHWRTFTNVNLNPRQAWTDMEQHTFMELVRDYESLGGNDFVHKVILPEMSRLEVICYADDLDAIKELFDSRNTPHACNIAAEDE